MYSVKFTSQNGDIFVFDHTNNIVFDVDGLSGMDIKHTMSQAAGQVGETISVKSIGSKTLTLTGVIFRDFAGTKERMRKAFAPLSEGRLIFNGKYYVDVSVKSAPTFSPVANKGNFTMQLLAADPFFKKADESNFSIGGITKAFQFPVNYSTRHRFASRSAALYANIYNGGDVESDFKLTLSTDTTSKNPTLSNLETFEKLKINRTLNQGEKISVYRDSNGILKVVLIDENGVETNIFADLDEESNLFALHRGDNLLVRGDDNGGTHLIADITFNEPVAGVYDED